MRVQGGVHKSYTLIKCTTYLYKKMELNCKYRQDKDYGIQEW